MSTPAILGIFALLTLALLVARVLANDPDNPAAPDDFAAFADSLD
jgi:hypothetical protein